MRSYKILGIILTLPFLTACVTIAKAQTNGEMETFFQKGYTGLSIIVNATAETVPGGNLTTKIWMNCTAEGVNVECFNVSLYGFRGGQEKILLNSTRLLSNISLNFNEVRTFDLFIAVPLDVWGRMQAELYLQYNIGSDHFLRDPAFSLTYVRNIYYGKLQEDFMNLNQSYWQTKSELEELNQTYINLQQEHATLNQTYWELLQNYTKLQGNIVELDNTRRLAVALGITTVFFVATTFYVVTRKPKQYW